MAPMSAPADGVSCIRRPSTMTRMRSASSQDLVEVFADQQQGHAAAAGLGELGADLGHGAEAGGSLGGLQEHAQLHDDPPSGN